MARLIHPKIRPKARLNQPVALICPVTKKTTPAAQQHSVLSGITVTDGQGNTVTTDHIRDTLDGANETLKYPAEEDLNALEIFAGTLVAVELNNQIGNLAMFNDSKDENAGWQEGGVNKVVTHFLNGSLTHLLTGGDSSDALSAWFGAAAVEATMAHLNTGDAANDQLVASLIGGAVSSLTGGSFDDGAISGAFAESFNRQMHDREIQWIKENVEVFAAQQGISEKEAIAVLAQQALRMVDTTWKNVLDEDKVFGDKASDFLSDGGNGLFTVSLKERDAYYTGFENIGLAIDMMESVKISEIKRRLHELADFGAQEAIEEYGSELMGNIGSGSLEGKLDLVGALPLGRISKIAGPIVDRTIGVTVQTDGGAEVFVGDKNVGGYAVGINDTGEVTGKVQVNYNNNAVSMDQNNHVDTQVAIPIHPNATIGYTDSTAPDKPRVYNVNVGPVQVDVVPPSNVIPVIEYNTDPEVFECGI